MDNKKQSYQNRALSRTSFSRDIYNLPNNKGDVPDIINRLLLKASSGRYSDIVIGIAQEKTLLNFSDSNKNTILHYILRNADLTKTEKYDLIKKCIELGAPIDTPNNDDIRPLHLAAEQQNQSVVKYLLAKHAEPNSRTKLNQTPLHFAVMPQLYTCPKTSFIKTNLLQIKNNNNTINPKLITDDLFDSLFLFIRDDNTIRNYVKHISNIFRSNLVYKNMSDDGKELKKITHDILGIKDTTSSGRNFEDLSKEKMTNFIKKISERTKLSLSKTLSEIDIKENTENGWGPIMARGITMSDKDKSNLQILPFPNLSSVYQENMNIFIKDIESKIKTMNKMKLKLKTRISSIYQHILNVNGVFNDLLSIYDFLLIWGNDIMNGDARVNRLINLLTSVFNNPLAPADIGAGFIRSNMIPDTDFETINNFNNIIVKAPTNVISFQGTVNQNYFSDYSAIPNQNAGIGVILEHYHGNISDVYDLLDNSINNLLTNINPIRNITNNNEIYHEIGEIQFRLLNLVYNMFFIGHYLNDLSKILNNINSVITAENLQPVIDEVNKIIKEITDNYEGQKNNTRYDLINRINIAAPINNGVITSNRNYSKNGIKVLIIENGNFLELYQRQAMPPAPVAGYYINNGRADVRYIDSNVKTVIFNPAIKKTVYNKINEKIGQYITESSQNGIISNLYADIIEFQKKTNEFIDMYNEFNGYVFINGFNNNMIDNSYNMRNTEIYRNIILTNIASLNKLPENQNKFNKELESRLLTGGVYTNINAINTIKNILDNYGFNIKTPINQKINIVRPRTPIDPIGINVINQTDGIIKSISRPTNPASTLSVQGVILGIPEQIISGNHRYDKFGSVNIMNDVSIITQVFDFHIYVIKLIILMYVAQKLYDIFLRADNNNILFTHMKKLTDDISILSNKNPFGIVLATSLKLTESIFISTITNISALSASNYILHIANNYNINDKPFATLLANSKLQEKSILIVKPDDKIRLKDNDIVSSVLSEGVNRFLSKNQNTDPAMINMFGPIDNNLLHNNSISSQSNNFDQKELMTEMCYNVENDIISDLLSKGADPNIMALSGETPLMLAVIIKNEEIVQTLLYSGAKVKDDTKYNLYDFLYNMLIDSMSTSPIMTIQEKEDKVNNHISQITDIDHKFPNNHLILKMASYMFSHQLTLYANTYPNMWSYKTHQQILDILNLTNINKDLIPLAKINPNIIEENIRGFSALNDTLLQHNHDLTNLREKILRIDNSINNLNLELTNLKSLDRLRKAEIDGVLRDLVEERNIISINMNNIIKKIRLLNKGKHLIQRNVKNAADITNKNIQRSTNLYSLVKAIAGKKSHDVCNIYDVFFTRIVSSQSKDVENSEYITYNKLWDELVSTNYESDHTQLIYALYNHILKTSKVLLQPDVFLDAFDPICELYDKVLNKYGRDYFELMPYLSKDLELNYDSNYVLNQIFCIMVHVFKHTMSVNFINTIGQYLIKHNEGKIESYIIRNIYQSLKTSGFIKHVYENLPSKVIKSVCKISSTDNDHDVNSSVKDILNKSIDLLTLSTFESISSSTIDNIKSSIIPYFTVYMESYTAEMHMLLISQLKLITEQSKMLNVLKLLASKSILEK